MGSGTSKTDFPECDIRIAQSTVQGRRQYNEDRQDCRHPLIPVKRPKDSSTSFFAVYDGHGGEWTAQYCVDNLHECLAKQPNYHATSKNKDQALAKAFQLCDANCLTEQETSGERSGTTAVVVLVDSQFIYSANCGDSRAVLCRDGTAIELSRDHKPTDTEERNRIESAGGKVPAGSNYAELNDKGLAVSRAFGNLLFKQNPGKKVEEQIIVSTPYQTKLRRELSDEFILLASDGLWNIMDNQKACDWVRDRLCKSDDLEDIVCKLTQYALDRKSQDNVTAVLIVFPVAYDCKLKPILRDPQPPSVVNTPTKTSTNS